MMWCNTHVANLNESIAVCSICKRRGHTAEQHKDLVDLGIIKESV